MKKDNLRQIKKRNQNRLAETRADYFLGADIDEVGVKDLWSAYKEAISDIQELLKVNYRD